MSDPIDHIKNRIDRPGDLSLQVHSLFVNLEGTRYIGQPGGLPDLCLEGDSITFVHGRLPHCGKGRSRAQGSHIVMHVFVRVCLPSTVCWESLSLQQQEDLWRTLPDIVERGGLMDNIDWPKAGKYLDCPRCRLRRPAFRCGKCEQECCLVCTLTNLCSVCESNANQKRESKRNKRVK